MITKNLLNIVANQQSFYPSSRRVLVGTSRIVQMQHLNMSVAVVRPSIETMTSMLSSRFFSRSIGGLNCNCSKSTAGKLTKYFNGTTKRTISCLIQREQRTLFSEQLYVLRQFSQQPQQQQQQQQIGTVTARPRKVGGKKHPSSYAGGSTNDDGGGMYFVKAGLPMLLFCGLGVWVMKNGLEGKNRERDAFQGRISKYVPIRDFCVCVCVCVCVSVCLFIYLFTCVFKKHLINRSFCFSLLCVDSCTRTRRHQLGRNVRR